MSAPVKLTAAQLLILRDAAESRKGFTLAPGGYTKAGPDASRWWRSARILIGHGFAKRLAESDGIVITQAGYEALAREAGHCLDGLRCLAPQSCVCLCCKTAGRAALAASKDGAK